MWTERNRSSANWRKSSYSSGNGQCVEVADSPSGTAVRDTTHRDLGALLFDVHEWRTFIDSTKARP
ncbi:DUF397 domain-containing protein [Nocardiopsis sp. NPDC055551]